MSDLFTYAASQPTPVGSTPAGVPVDVALLFERLALEMWRRGRKRFSARAILHRIRWEMVVERDGVWKCNNNHTSTMSRWLMAKHPDMAGFFETREQS